MKCDRCGCEMELDGYILSEIAEADGDDELSCICMKCGKGTIAPGQEMIYLVTFLHAEK